MTRDMANLQMDEIEGSPPEGKPPGMMGWNRMTRHPPPRMRWLFASRDAMRTGFDQRGRPRRSP